MRFVPARSRRPSTNTKQSRTPLSTPSERNSRRSASDDAVVTEPAVDRLEFYLQSYEVPVDRENEGVLLADAKSAAHVDRAVVFYLGLDEGWTQSSPRRPWVDREQEFERNIRQFQRLLQNGVDQYYLVQDTAGGTPVTPCLYFEELFDEEFDRFSDLDSLQHSRASRTTRDGFETEPLDVSPRGSHRIQPVEPEHLRQLTSRLLLQSTRRQPGQGPLQGKETCSTISRSSTSPIRTPSRQTHSDEVAAVILDEVDPFLGASTGKSDSPSTASASRPSSNFLDANPPKGDGLSTPDSGWGRELFRRVLRPPHRCVAHRTLVREP